MYKGYLKGSGKHAASKFKDGEKLLTYNTVRKNNSYVGILDDDYIMVDVDDRKSADILYKIIKDKEINCSILKTTKGMHFYFKGYTLTKNKIRWYANVGLYCDYKLGTKNTADPLKIDGQIRKWLKKSRHHDPLPIWLYPYARKNPSLNDLGEGDGRNNTLYTYILKMQGQGLSKTDIRTTISIINNYILNDPVEESELQTIMRDEAFLKESFIKDGHFSHDQFSRFLINEHHICNINDVLHIYREGIYTDNVRDIEGVMLKHISTLKHMQRQEVLRYLQIKAPVKSFSDTRYIGVNNGLFDLATWALVDYNPSIILRNKIPVNYVENSYYEVTDKTLSKIAKGDKDIRSILEEMFGYVLFRRNEYGAIFIFTGNGSNGKSSLLDMLKAFVGQHNTSSLDIKEINQRFKTSALFGKLANIGDDISSGHVKESSILKKLGTGETINVERKGKDPFDFDNYAKLIFSANDIPTIHDFSDGLRRRLQIVPFRAKFSRKDKDFDPFITDKLLSEKSMEYLLCLALRGLKSLIDNKGFTNSKLVQKELEEYFEENNSVISFIKNEEVILDRSLVSEIYDVYRKYCSDNGYKPFSKNNFSKQIKNNFRYNASPRKINGESKRLFIKMKEDD